MAERLLRPEDVKDAATWYFGFEPVSDGPCPRRVTTAKWVYWAALRQIGLSRLEVAELMGIRVPALKYAERKGVPQCYVDGVLARARSVVADE